MSAPIIDIDENLRLLGTAHVATASVEAVKGKYRGMGARDSCC